MDIKKGFELIKTPDDWKEKALHHRKNEQIKITHSKSAGIICAALAAVVIGGAMVSVQKPHRVKTISSAASTEQEKADSKTAALKNKDSKEYVGREEAERLLGEIGTTRLFKGTIVSANNQSQVMIALGDEYTPANASSVVTVSFADCRNLTFGDTGGKFYTTSDYCKSGNSIEFIATANSIYYTDEEMQPEISAYCSSVSSELGRPLAVEVMPLVNYYPAEEYHQKYLDKNPRGYCHIPSSYMHLEN